MRPGIDDPGTFIRAADDQLYAAKNAGRNQACG
jgi:PleD family two-component response regulator